MINYKWLNEYKRTCREIKYLKWNINKIKGQLGRSGIRALLHETIETESETELTMQLNQMQEQLKDQERLHCFYTEVFALIEDETDKEILQLTIEGHPTSSIAKHLFICEGYVRDRRAMLADIIQFLIDCRP